MSFLVFVEIKFHGWSWERGGFSPLEMRENDTKMALF
jgi:hypothetical protein